MKKQEVSSVLGSIFEIPKLYFPFKQSVRKLLPCRDCTGGAFELVLE